MRTENPPYLQHAEVQQAYPGSIKTAPQPTAAQEERRAQLRRFNRLTITLPVGLTIVLWLALLLAMIWVSIAGEWFAMDTNQAYYRELLSGIADVVTMLLLAPMLLLCALPIAGAIGLMVYRRRKKDDSGDKEPSLPLFWRIENKVIMVHDAVARAVPKLARPVINGHSTIAYLKQLVLEVKRLLGRR